MSSTNLGERTYPLLPLRNILVFPGTTSVLEVGRSRSLKALEMAKSSDMQLVLCAQKDNNVSDPEPSHLHNVGTLGIIKEVVKSSGSRYRIVVYGLTRVEVASFETKTPGYTVKIRELLEKPLRTRESDILLKAIMEQYEDYVRVTKKVPAETLISIAAIQDAGQLSDSVAGHIPIPLDEKQELLEAQDVNERAKKLIGFLAKEIELQALEKKLNRKVREQIEKGQKEYWLREQMKAIQRELGDKDDTVSESEEFRKKIKEAKLPPEAKERALKEVDRLSKMPQAAAEAVVVRTYLEWIVSLPWSVVTEDRLDLHEAENILDEDHYGLKDVKERILEYLAIRQLVDKPKGPILCLVGPPGVGKTSLAKSIARSLDRKFVRISLGGVRDESEIRGHRRTYIGAMPGRIIQGMRTSGSKNPVFLMDEVDKLAQDYRGDPASALLEVLDPEQNNTFSDNYLEIPFDLSRVMFITTANTLHSIPKPLLDRMEVITIPGYTEEEKIEIGTGFLIPKQLKEHGLKAGNLSIAKDSLKEIVRSYTREAGVRNLERQVATLCRKTARDIVSGKKKRARVTPKNLHKYLGIPRYHYGQAEKENQVGVATALAVTDVGGDVMSCEVSVVKGKGHLTLTGHLGDVMKESGQAALSYLRSRACVLGLSEDFYEKVDIHVHVPEGAIPKDGPSAGITIACAIASALTNDPVRHDIAMTGEVTLRGRVLPIGGVKEKVMAAHRSGIMNVILPRKNEKDLEDIPTNIMQDLKVILVEHMDEVLDAAIVKESPRVLVPCMTETQPAQDALMGDMG